MTIRLPMGVGTALLIVFLLPATGRAQGTDDSRPEISEIGGLADAKEGEGLAFGVAVFNPSGETLEFQWDFGDDSDPVSGPHRAVTHRYMQDGEFVVRLQVSGSGGFSTTRRFDIVVTNAPPVIRGLSHDDFEPGQPTDFRSDAADPGDDELTYTWDFGDGSEPRSAVDLREVTHVYEQPGDYVVRLSVVDDDGEEAVRELAVSANPGLLGEIAGQVPRFPFAGTSGRSALFSGLGGVPGFTGAAPMLGGVADLSGMMGVCLVNAGFWDDEHKAHINFVLTLPSDSAFQHKTYPLRWEHSDRGLAKNQLLINAFILGVGSMYEDTKAGAQKAEIVGGAGSYMDMMSGSMEAMRRMWDAKPEHGPGRNWQLNAHAGAVTIYRITSDRMYGKLQAYMRGGWTEAGQSGPVQFAQIQGMFAWRMDEVAQANFARCANLPFTIESHTPTIEERNVDFVSPTVSITFTQQYRRQSVNAETIQVGYLNEQSEFVPIEGDLIHDSNGRTVHFTRDERLMDAVYYHVRVRGGESGVRSVGNDTLVEDYQWRFATVVDLLPLPNQ